jgi:hypothetical protein
MADKNGGFSGGNMLKGLSNRSPPASDSSTRLPSGKGVDSEATRSEIAPNLPVQGPRSA